MTASVRQAIVATRQSRRYSCYVLRFIRPPVPRELPGLRRQACATSSPAEIKTGELLRALIVVGPLVAAYFTSRETALLNLGLIAVSLLHSRAAGCSWRRK